MYTEVHVLYTVYHNVDELHTCHLKREKERKYLSNLHHHFVLSSKLSELHVSPYPIIHQLCDIKQFSTISDIWWKSNTFFSISNINRNSPWIQCKNSHSLRSNSWVSGNVASQSRHPWSYWRRWEWSHAHPSLDRWLLRALGLVPLSWKLINKWITLIIKINKKSDDGEM